LLASLPRIMSAVRKVSSAVLGGTAGLSGTGSHSIGSALASSAVGAAGGGYGGGGNTYVTFDVHGNHMMSDTDMDKFINKLGHRFATHTTVAAGRKFNIRG